MSSSTEPSDSSKPVLKDKNPHNYRKVGYSMIVISVSLVLIGLLVWAIGDNYHFSGDIMAKQEIDSMTPKSGYAIVEFDYTQPIGAKLKLLDSASSLETAVKLKDQYTQDYLGQKGQVLIFDTSITNNTNSVSIAEVYAMTPIGGGYNVVSFNTVMPVGARLSGQKLETSLGEAINDTAKYSADNTDKLTQILTFTPSLEDNLKQILGSKYDPALISENINQIKSMPPKLVLPKPSTPVVSNNATQTTTVAQNVTRTAAHVNVTDTANVASLVSSSTTEKLSISANMSNHLNLNNTKSSMPASAKVDKITITANVTASNLPETTGTHVKTQSLSENVTIRGQ